MGSHPDSVTEQRATAVGRGRIDGEHRDPQATLPIGADRRGLPGPGRSRDPDDARGGGAEYGENLVATVAFDQAQQSPDGTLGTAARSGDEFFDIHHR